MPRRFAFGIAAIAIVGCADGGSGPTGAQQLSVSEQEHAEAPVVGRETPPADAVTTTFTLHTNAGGDFRIGGEHWIHFPRNAVCDPATSTYGVGEWDAPCTPLSGPISITATSWRDVEGRPHIDFSPALRFVPDNKSNGWVHLTFADPMGSRVGTAEILWCGSDGTCVDEGTADATLETNRSAKLGTISRRIKHFSGYMVTAGRMSALAL